MKIIIAGFVVFAFVLGIVSCKSGSSPSAVAQGFANKKRFDSISHCHPFGQLFHGSGLVPGHSQTMIISRGLDLAMIDTEAKRPMPTEKTRKSVSERENGGGTTAYRPRILRRLQNHAMDGANMVK